MSNVKVCLYGIMKNESHNVVGWYNSGKEADLVFLMDTGSTEGDEKIDTVMQELKNADNLVITTDSTYLEILKDEGFDFARARNWCLDLAMQQIKELEGDSLENWVFFSLDLDERIQTKGWAQEIRDNWIVGKHHWGSYWYVWSHTKNNKEGRAFRYHKIHDYTLKWKYPVHEVIVNPETGDEYPHDGEMLDTHTTVWHYPDNKERNYLPLIKKRAEMYPEHAWSQLYLLHEYKYTGDYQRCVKESIELLNSKELFYTDFEKANIYLFQGDSYRAIYNLAQQYEVKYASQIHKAIAAYINAIVIYPTYLDPYIRLAEVYNDLKLHHMAFGVLTQGKLTWKQQYSWLEQTGEFEYYDALSIALYYMGEEYRDAALDAVTKAKEINPIQRVLDNFELMSK